MPTTDRTPALHTSAEFYSELGWSVIPVQNDKVAAVAWKPYQTRRPTQADLQTWFKKATYPGLAIVTGLISNLVVLDFDDSQLFQQFQSHYGYLTDTRTVQTRRGYHLYFSLAPGVRLASRKVPGLDLQSDGRYVVAPPSCLDGHTYKVTRGGQPKVLTAHDAQLIQAFLASLGSVQFENNLCVTENEARSPVLTSQDLVCLYRHLAPQQGRNEALFKVSLRARDSGLNLQQTISALVDVHIGQPTTNLHKSETPDHRQQEAKQTIQSAFSRPPRPVKQAEPQQLPNTVREKLFQLKETRVVRVIEGLRLKGIQPGQAFTTKEALNLLQGIVGRDSVYAALNACTPENTPFFEQANPSPGTLTPADAATDTQSNLTTKCFVVRVQKSGKSPRHRPARVFVMPGNLELAGKVGVKPTRRSDSLTENDLRSAKTTRQAAHRGLIQRRPGRYSRSWLAGRLGVAIRTLHAYNREIPIQEVPTYLRKPIFWRNINAVPVGLDIPGLFLQDETGKRYPAQQPIARKLLRQGRQVMLVRRSMNYYFYGDQPPAVPHLWVEQPRIEKTPTYVIQQPVYIELSAVAPSSKQATQANRPEGVPAQQHRGQSEQHRPPRRTKRFYRKPLPDTAQEQQAQRIVAWVQALTDNTAYHISQVSARKLVDEHGVYRVQSAMKRIAKRRHITNPTGFLVTLLRSEAKASAYSSGGK